jgi:hypothetical protein
MVSNMDAEPVVDDLIPVDEVSFAQLVIWKVPMPVRGSNHLFKYRLAYVVRDQCVLRYDNEAGKGDHIHLGDVERPYEFRSIRRLLRDFWNDVERFGV